MALGSDGGGLLDDAVPTAELAAVGAGKELGGWVSVEGDGPARLCSRGGGDGGANVYTNVSADGMGEEPVEFSNVAGNLVLPVDPSFPDTGAISVVTGHASAFRSPSKVSPQL